MLPVPVATAAARLRSGRGGLLVMALVVGLGAGLGAVAFRRLIVHATRIFSGSEDFSVTAVGRHPGNHWVPWLGGFFVVLAPVAGGLLYGPLVDRFAREAKGHGVPEVMYAVAQRGGRIQGRVAVVKALASALCIGSGGSVGREGPIVQIGSALGSWLGRTFRVPETRLRTLVACGAAGGIAATFNAPVAGVFFALELLLRDFAAEAFGVVVLAAVVASVVGRAFFGDTPFLHLPAFTIAHPAEYLLYALLGLLAGIVGVCFTRVLYAIEDVCDWVWRGPEWARPAVGGLVLGLLLLVLPQLYGVGYPVLQAGVEGRYALAFLVVLLLGKMLATSLTIGIGGSGGVFAPSLFIGAMFGAAFGDVVHVLAPGVAGPTGAYALVGMGAVFAGSARAPITAVLIMFELTGEYTIILPLMLAIVLATAVSHRLSADTVYTLKLRRRGVDLDAPAGDPRLRTVRVADVMVQPPPALRADLHLPAAARAVLASGRPAVPVSRDGTLLGVVTARAVSEALADDAEARAHEVASLASMPEVLQPDDPLSTALQVLVTADSAGAPVLDHEHRMVGWLTHASVLRVLTRDVAGDPRAASAGSLGTGTDADLTDVPAAAEPVRRRRIPGPV
ncbi:MAG: chloride channel protein [Motilibacteraceae bacterium]